MKTSMNTLAQAFVTKCALVLYLAVLGVSSAFAQVETPVSFTKDSGLPLYLEGPNIVIGQDYQLRLKLENDKQLVSCLQLDLTLPKGVTFDEAHKLENFVPNENRINSDLFDTDINAQRLAGDPNRYRITIVSLAMEDLILDDTDPTLVTINLKVSTDFLNTPNKAIKVDHIELVGVTGNDKLYEDIYGTFAENRAFTFSLEPAAADLSFVDNSIGIIQGQTADVVVSMENFIPLRDFQFEINLPEGLTLAKNEKGKYAFEREDRLPASHRFNVAPLKDKPNGFRVVVASMRADQIAVNQGPLFRFTVVADENFVQDQAEMEINKVIYTDNSAHGYKWHQSITTTFKNYTTTSQSFAEQIETLRTNQAAAETHVAENCPAVSAEWVTAQVTAIQTSIDALAKTLEALNQSYQFDESQAEFEQNVNATQEAIDKFKAEADQLQQDHEADVAKKAANDEAFARLNEQLAGVQSQLDAANEAIAKDCKDVASQFDEVAASLQSQLDALKADVAKKHEAVELTAESTVDTQALIDGIAQMQSDAKAAQAAHEADVAKKAANDEAYQRLVAVLDVLEKKVESARFTLLAECKEVSKDYLPQIDNLLSQVKELRAALEAQYKRVELDAASTLDVTAIENALQTTLDEARKAQAAYEAEQTQKADNEAAYSRLNNQLDLVQVELNSAKKSVQRNYPDVAAKFEDKFAQLQTQLDELKQQLDASYREGILNAESTIDTSVLSETISTLLDEAASEQKQYEKKVLDNETGYQNLMKQLEKLQNVLDEAIETINTECPDVAENYKSYQQQLQESIDMTRQQIEELYDAMQLDAESVLETADFEAAIKNMVDHAKKETGIDEVLTDSDQIDVVYTLQGKRVSAPVKGWNIVKMKNGTTRKVYVK